MRYKILYTCKFLRHLLGITKLDKEKTNVLGKKQRQRI
jgi:hypothetical protein